MIGAEPRARRNWKLRRAARLRRHLSKAIDDGRSLHEAAHRLGLSPETARRLLSDNRFS
jgi:DNA-binding IclR family transcriptional regulator